MKQLLGEYIFEISKVTDREETTVIGHNTGEKIVRCRDCEYFDNDFSSGWCERLFICDERDGFSVSENDYCSFGVEKEA